MVVRLVDPELRVFGSEKSQREIIALRTQKVKDCCARCIIAVGAIKNKFYALSSIMSL